MTRLRRLRTPRADLAEIPVRYGPDRDGVRRAIPIDGGRASRRKRRRWGGRRVSAAMLPMAISVDSDGRELAVAFHQITADITASVAPTAVRMRKAPTRMRLHRGLARVPG